LVTLGSRRRSARGIDQLALVVAVATIAAFLLLLWVSFAATDRMAATQGPTRMGVAPDGSVWVNSHAGLHHLARDGALLQSVVLADLGLATPLSTVRVLRDGRLIVGQAVPSGLFLCDLERTRCERLTSAGETAHALMIAVDERTGRIAVSDNAGYRLLLLDLNGRRILDATPRGRFSHPNGIAFLSDDTLLVANTDRRALVTLEVGGERFGRRLETFWAYTGPLRPGRILPMEFARTADGKWWMLVAMDRMKNADLVIHDPLGVPRMRIDLGARSDPTDVTAFGDGVLVAEPTRVRLLAIDKDGTNVRQFGSPEFLAQLDATRSAHALWTLGRDFAPTGMAMLPLLCALFLWARGRREPGVYGPVRRELLPAPATLEPGVTWLQYDPRYLLRYGRTRTAVFGAGMVLLVAMVFVLTQANPGLPPTVIGVMVAVIALCLGALYYMRRRGKKPPHYGVDETGFVLRTPDGEVQRISPEALRTDGRRLVAGPEVVTYRSSAGDTFSGSQLESVLLARLPPEAWIPSRELWLWALRRQPQRVLVEFLAIAALTIALAVAAAWVAGLTLD